MCPTKKHFLKVTRAAVRNVVWNRKEQIRGINEGTLQGLIENCGAFKTRNRRDLETFCDLGGGNDWPWCLVAGGRLWEVAGGSQHLGPSSRVDDVLDQVGEAWGRTGPGGGAQASCGRVQAL